MRTIPYDIGTHLENQLRDAFFDTYNKFQLGPLDSYLFSTPPGFPHHTLLMVWSALLRFRNAGRVRQVGFVTDRTFETETALEFLKRETGEKVQVLQQAFPSSELTAYCRHNGIQLQYVPIQYIFVPCSTVPQATTRGTVSVGGTSPSTNATGDLGGEQ